SPESAAAYAEAFRRYRPTHLVVYPSSAHVLATAVQEQGLKLPDSVRVVFSNAEKLQDAQRERIGAAFGSPVVNTYGMVEAVVGAGECDRGTMHLWPEAGYLEVLSTHTDHPTEEGTVGRLVATGLLN